jgi:hypothetical protein
MNDIVYAEGTYARNITTGILNVSMMAASRLEQIDCHICPARNSLALPLTCLVVFDSSHGSNRNRLVFRDADVGFVVTTAAATRRYLASHGYISSTCIT